MGKAVLINDRDNVVTTASEVRANEEVSYQVGSETRWIRASEDIAYGHKLALTNVAKGTAIIKYGEIIGRAKVNIQPGEWVHIHNTDETYTPSR